MMAKRQMIDLDIKRQKIREALRCFYKGKVGADDAKVWTCAGPFFMKLSSEQTKEMLLRDQEEVCAYFSCLLVNVHMCVCNHAYIYTCLHAYMQMYREDTYICVVVVHVDVYECSKVRV